MAYPKAFIEELKMRNNIAETVGRYVTLGRSGSNMTGLCPFHSERSPSFTVFSDHFHCFGCGAGGDVITFTMKIENLDYRSAIEVLAQRAGLQVPQDDGFVNVKKEVLSRERGFEMNKLAARYFHDNLMKAPEANKARQYLADRGLDTATVRHFGLGFAKDSFNDLLNYLTGRGFSVEELKAGFLCAQSQKGNYYDIFRNRVIFPIIDTVGNVVAFGGRVMDDSKPKYLNSSDTPVFKKSRNLFAMNFAKGACLGDEKNSDSVSGAGFNLSGKLIMCEGYMDVIALHKAGFTNAVATLGTAVTSEHARFVSRYAKTVYLAYDSDGAGKNATKKAVSLLAEVGIDAKVINIVGAKDPDEYIKKYGGAAFARLLEGSVGQIDFRLSEILGRYDMSNPDDRERAVRDACEMLAGIFPEYRRDIYIARLCELTGVSRASCEAEIRRREKKAKGNIQKNIAKSSIEEMKHYNDKINPESVKYPKAVVLEERILGILMLYPEHLASVAGGLCPEDFITEFNKSVYSRILEIYEGERFDLSYLNEFFTPDQMGRIHGMMEKRRELSANGLEAIGDATKALAAEKRRLCVKDSEDSFLERIRASKEKKRVTDDSENK